MILWKNKIFPFNKSQKMFKSTRKPLNSLVDVRGCGAHKRVHIVFVSIPGNQVKCKDIWDQKNKNKLKK